MRDQATLQRFVARLEAQRCSGQWIEDAAHGPAYRCATPDGHAVELYWETRRFVATPEVATAFKNQPQRYVPGASRRGGWTTSTFSRVTCSATRRFFHELLGLRLTEQIIFDDGNGDGRVAVGDQQVVRRRRSRTIAAARRDGCITSPT